MPPDVLRRWFGEPTRPSWAEWEEVVESYMAERDLEREVVTRHVPQHPAFDTAMFDNWLRLLPTERLTRLCSTDDLYREFSSVISEVYGTLEADVDGQLESAYSAFQGSSDDPVADAERKSGIEAYLCTQIGGQLRGDVNLDGLRRGAYEAPDSHLTEPPDGSLTVEIRRRNSANLEDVAIFTVDDGFFDGTFGDNTRMFSQLYDSRFEPDRVLRNVAFDWEGNSWVGGSPPNEPIIASSTDHKNRVGYYEIEDPSAMYGDSWGDLSAMADEENSDSESVTHIHSDEIDWTLATGLRC